MQTPQAVTSSGPDGESSLVSGTATRVMIREHNFVSQRQVVVEVGRKAIYVDEGVAGAEEYVHPGHRQCDC